jgi:selenocysteine-specific elongation factor
MIIGTAGHIDHGKTSLVRALSGVDTDRLKEEKARGISIELGFAYMTTPSGATLGFIDAPGHERFIHTMLAGAGGVDFALLVIAADDGVMPQTREHVAILDLLGVGRGFVVITKVDLVDEKRVTRVEREAQVLLAETDLAQVPIHRVSTATGAGVAELKDALFAAEMAFRGRVPKGLFRLAVDRSFTLQGSGTIVTGTVFSGAVASGERVTISPSGLAARIRAMHVQNRPAERAQVGDRAALNLTGDGVTKNNIVRGDMVLDPRLHAPTDRIDARIRILTAEKKPIGQWAPIRLHSTASEVGARIVLLGEPIAPGESGWVQLVLERPIAATAGDRFVARDTSARRTIGGGRFLDLRAPARRRRAPQRLAQLAALALSDAAEVASGLLTTPPHYLDLDAFARDRALGPDDADTLLESLRLAVVTSSGSRIVMTATSAERLWGNIHGTLGAFHAANPELPGMGFERLRTAVEPRLPAIAFREMLQKRARAGYVKLDGAWVRLPSHETRLTDLDEALWRRIEPRLLGESRFRPPRVRDLVGLVGAPESEVRRVLKLVARMGAVYEIAHDHFFPRAVVTEMIGIIRDVAGTAEKGWFSAAQFRDRVENGRKVAIQVLDFFDRHGATLRRGDQRRVDPRRLELFTASAEGPTIDKSGGDASPVGRPDFKSGRGRESVLGGFDSHSPPPKALEL